LSSKIERGDRALPKSLAYELANRYRVTRDFLYEGKTRGLSPEWLRKLLASAEGIALIAPDDTAQGKDTEQL
jgi:hypothetical protein